MFYNILSAPLKCIWEYCPCYTPLGLRDFPRPVILYPLVVKSQPLGNLRWCILHPSSWQWQCATAQFNIKIQDLMLATDSRRLDCCHSLLQAIQGNLLRPLKQRKAPGIPVMEKFASVEISQQKWGNLLSLFNPRKNIALEQFSYDVKTLAFAIEFCTFDVSSFKIASDFHLFFLFNLAFV